MILVNKKLPTSKKATSKYFPGVGRRKEAVAQVRIFKGKGSITVNHKDYKEYFSSAALFNLVTAPLEVAKQAGNFDVTVIVKGGGAKGQAEAVRHGIARALERFDKNLRTVLKKSGYLRRDPRMKERKKYGLKKARRAPQWQKR